MLPMLCAFVCACNGSPNNAEELTLHG
jgi:hypothetical protein